MVSGKVCLDSFSKMIILKQACSWLALIAECQVLSLEQKDLVPGIPRVHLKVIDIEPNDIGHVFGTPSIFFVKGWSVPDVCVEGNLKINLSCLSPGGL